MCFVCLFVSCLNVQFAELFGSYASDNKSLVPGFKDEFIKTEEDRSVLMRYCVIRIFHEASKLIGIASGGSGCSLKR